MDVAVERAEVIRDATKRMHVRLNGKPLGLVTLYLSRFVLPETITPILGAISGLTIVWVGATLLYRRTIGKRTDTGLGIGRHATSFRRAPVVRISG